MRASTLIGALAGAAALGGAGLGIAYAAKKKPEGEEPFFLYTMQSGDTLSELALKFFGDAKKWPALLDGKPPADFRVETLPPGTLLRVPCVWETVQKGDTLAAIAQRALGDGGRWRRIAEANKKTLPDPNKLAVGQRLAVPIAPVATPATPSVKAELPVLGSDLDLLDAETCP